MAKVRKNYKKPKHKQPALTTARAVATRNIKKRMPSNSFIADIPIRTEDKDLEITRMYGTFYHHYVQNGKFYDKYIKNPADTHRSEYTRGRMSKKGVETAKELKHMPDMKTFRAMDPEEQAKTFLRLNSIIKENKVEGTTRLRPALEQTRAQWLNTNKLTEATKKYLRKGDLKTTNEYLNFLELAKNRTGQYANMAYFEGMETYYDKINNAKKFTSEEKQLLAFIEYQLEFETDARRRELIIKKASSIRINDKNLFDRKTIEQYS